jgi:SPX domain protein involved in polyphosphate accumulation
MRYEYKYLISDFQLSSLRAKLKPFVQLDNFASQMPTGDYTVRSIYFDSPNMEMYHSKCDHLAHRMKVRLRSYNLEIENAATFLEIKRKYEGPIVKNRAKLPFHAVVKIFRGESIENFLPITNKADNVRRFFYQIHSKRLQPVVNVIYEREPYLSIILDPENDLRITIDKNLRSVPFPLVDELYIEKNIRTVMDSTHILEVKFNNFCPNWLKPILSDMNLQKAPASKYIFCIDSHPEIKTNKRMNILAHRKFLNR